MCDENFTENSLFFKHKILSENVFTQKKNLMLKVKKKKPVESTVLFLVFYLKFYKYFFG